MLYNIVKHNTVDTLLFASEIIKPQLEPRASVKKDMKSIKSRSIVK
jgi:hypothetical protein